MKDELADFIRTNRSSFDDKEPPEKVWKQVEASLGFRSKQRNLWNSVMLWRAAAVIFMVLSVYLMIPKNPVKNESATRALKEFSDVEAFYTQEISQKIRLIEDLSEGEADDEFTPDFKQLEAMYLVLKEEMKSRPSKKVKDALELNLLVRINLLNQQLHRLEEEYGEEEKRESSI